MFWNEDDIRRRAEEERRQRERQDEERRQRDRYEDDRRTRERYEEDRRRREYDERRRCERRQRQERKKERALETKRRRDKKERDAAAKKHRSELQEEYSELLGGDPLDRDGTPDFVSPGLFRGFGFARHSRPDYEGRRGQKAEPAAQPEAQAQFSAGPATAFPKLNRGF